MYGERISARCPNQRQGLWQGGFPSKDSHDSVVSCLLVEVGVEKHGSAARAPRVLQENVVRKILVGDLIGNTYRVSDTPDGDTNTLCLIKAGFDNLCHQVSKSQDVDYFKAGVTVVELTLT